MHEANEIIDRIYTAAVDPAAWQEAVHAIRVHYGAISAGLYEADLQSGTVQLVHLEGIDAGEIAVYVERFLCENPWSVPEMQRPGRVRSDRSLDEYHGRPGYYRSTALFNEWMRPQDFIYTLGVNLTVDRHEQLKFFLYRPERRGPYSETDIGSFTRIARHMRNAAKVARRIGGAEAQATVALQVMDRLRFGVVLLDERANVAHANAFAHELFARRDGICLSGRTVVAAHRADGPLLARTIRAALEVRAGRDVLFGGASLRRPDGRRPLAVTALPLVRGAGAAFSREAAVALIVADPEQEPGIPAERLQQRFGLTSSEARLAARLAQGLSLRDAAEHVGITYETARWYLKSTFQKTGTSRQAELLRLLLSEPILSA